MTHPAGPVHALHRNGLTYCHKSIEGRLWNPGNIGVDCHTCQDMLARETEQMLLRARTTSDDWPDCEGMDVREPH